MNQKNTTKLESQIQPMNSFWQLKNKQKQKKLLEEQKKKVLNKHPKKTNDYFNSKIFINIKS